MRVRDRLAHAWNAFKANEKDRNFAYDFTKSMGGITSSYKMDRTPLRLGTERTILASIYNRIAIDVASIEIRHARVDANGRFLDEIKSGLNECLSVSANKDQTARAFLMDVVLSMFDEGTVAIAPIDTSLDITKSNSYDIQSMRCGKITQWMPDHVRVELYNDRVGRREELTLPKDKVAIIENPLYQVMNEPNSTMQRLRHKLALLDATDDKQNSDKLNMIIQLPYTIKSEARMKQAEERRKQVELQLAESKYGVAYVDSTEKIVQIGRPLENRLIEQIEYFTKELYSQLGLTPEVFNGTADERIMLNYNNRTIEPIISAIRDEMYRKFLTKTARSQGQSIVFFHSPFALVPVSNLGDIADSFIRNEILSSNEVRAILGYRPVESPRADELINKNINPVEGQQAPEGDMSSMGMGGDGIQVDLSDEELESMSDEELQEYLNGLQQYQDEVDDLDRMVDQA